MFVQSLQFKPPKTRDGKQQIPAAAAPATSDLPDHLKSKPRKSLKGYRNPSIDVGSFLATDGKCLHIYDLAWRGVVKKGGHATKEV